jgi:hypothetical protein
VVIADPVLPFTTCTRPTGHLGSHQHIVLLVAAEPRHEPDVVIEHVRESRRLSYRDGRIDGFIRGFCSALVLGLGIAALVVWL